jgi:hypothetical protein
MLKATSLRINRLSRLRLQKLSSEEYDGSVKKEKLTDDEFQRKHPETSCRDSRRHTKRSGKQNTTGGPQRNGWATC